jgi:hypothetical protein
VSVCLSLIIPIRYLAILSFIAMVGGLYFFCLGLGQFTRKRLLLTIPRCKISSPSLGLVEVNGVAAGPNTMPAPITGKPCFLYHTTAWQQRDGVKQEWERVADETLHLPFFITDSTGQLLIEPLGADLDLYYDFREEYAAPLFSSSQNEVPPRVSVFLSRHGIVLGRSLRIEEHLVKPEDVLFVTGTLTENPGVQVRPFSPRESSSRNAAANSSAEQIPAPEIIRLQSGDAPSSTSEMSQQAKIAAALTRAGITKPEAWSAAGIPYASVAIEENAPATVSADHDRRPRRDLPQSPGFDLTPPVVLMKGSNDSTFVISFRSQKELVTALALKSAVMLFGGAAVTLLGAYALLLRMGLL